MLVIIGVDSGAARAREEKVVDLKILIFKAKINTIPLALNIINYISSKSHTPDLPRDRKNPLIFPVFTNKELISI